MKSLADVSGFPEFVALVHATLRTLLSDPDPHVCFFVADMIRASGDKYRAPGVQAVCNVLLNAGLAESLELPGGAVVIRWRINEPRPPVADLPPVALALARACVRLSARENGAHQ